MMWITERLFYFLIFDRIETRKKKKGCVGDGYAFR